MALLQQSSNLNNHSVNHLKIYSKSNTSINCSIPINVTSESFILDTGVTDHVFFSQNFFSCLKKISLITFKISNGSMVNTDYVGTIFFYNTFIITNVLYMPQFSFKLIYVPNLTHCLDCQLIFNNSTYLIQNSYSKKIISATNFRRGL